MSIKGNKFQRTNSFFFSFTSIMSHAFLQSTEEQTKVFCTDVILPAIVAWIADKDPNPFITIAPSHLSQEKMNQISKYMKDTYPDIRFSLQYSTAGVTVVTIRNWSDNIESACPDHWPWTKTPGAIDVNEMIRHEGLIAVGPSVPCYTDASLRARWFGKEDRNIAISRHLLFESRGTHVYWFSLVVHPLPVVVSHCLVDAGKQIDEKNKHIAQLERELSVLRNTVIQIAKLSQPF